MSERSGARVPGGASLGPEEDAQAGLRRARDEAGHEARGLLGQEAGGRRVLDPQPARPAPRRWAAAPSRPRRRRAGGPGPGSPQKHACLRPRGSASRTPPARPRRRRGPPPCPRARSISAVAHEAAQVVGVAHEVAGVAGGGADGLAVHEHVDGPRGRAPACAPPATSWREGPAAGWPPVGPRPGSPRWRARRSPAARPPWARAPRSPPTRAAPRPPGPPPRCPAGAPFTRRFRWCRASRVIDGAAAADAPRATRRRSWGRSRSRRCAARCRRSSRWMQG